MIPGAPPITLGEAMQIVASKTHPKVTEESIRAKIAGAEYVKHGLTTVCFITMQNGFRFVGTSTPASEGNYDELVGQRYAYDNAFKQIWTHEGYLLREVLALVGDRHENAA